MEHVRYKWIQKLKKEKIARKTIVCIYLNEYKITVSKLNWRATVSRCGNPGGRDYC